MSKIDPMSLTNEARKEARARQAMLTRNLRDEIVTRPAVSEPVPRSQARTAYLGVRNNENEISALVERAKGQGGVRAVIRDLKEQERKLRRDEEGGRYGE